MLTPDGLAVAAEALDVRRPDPLLDAVDGVVPGLVVEPHTAEATAAALAWASERGLSVLVQGGASKRAWGRRPDRLDVILCTRRLTRVLDHRPGDLTVTVEAGLTLGHLNDTLGVHGQQLPLDPPSADRATIGGLLATNDSGPLRHRFGTPRDLVIGVQLATVDGRLTKAGGQVVKNVAGYDLSKLACGSFGSLAVIVAATFKLLPLPGASRTVLFEAGSAERLAAIAESMAASQLEPIAFEAHAARGPSQPARIRGLLRFAGAEAAVDAQAGGAARDIASAAMSVRTLSGGEELDLWRAHSLEAAPSDAMVRLSWLPADLVGLFDVLARVGRDIETEMIGRIGVGAGLLRIRGEVSQQAWAIEELRQSRAVGHVVVTSGPTELKAVVDVWGASPNTPLLRALQSAMDPHRTVGAGRGIV